MAGPVQRSTKIVVGLGVLSALVVVVCVALLLTEYLAERGRAPEEDAVVETLEEQVRLDAEVAEELHGERERQTEQVLSRKDRAERIAWVLLVAGGVLVGCGKRYMSRRPQRSPALDALVACQSEVG